MPWAFLAWLAIGSFDAPNVTAQEIGVPCTIETDKKLLRLRFAFSPDSQTIAFTNDSEELILYDLNKCETKKIITNDSGVNFSGIVCMTFTPDGKTIIAGGYGKSTFRFFDAATRNPKTSITTSLRGGLMSAIALSPDGNTLALSGFRHHVTLWDIQQAKARSLIPANGGNEGLFVSFTPDGKKMIVPYHEINELRIWDVATGKESAVLKPEDRGGYCTVLFAPDGRSIAAVCPPRAGEPGCIHFWDVETEKITAQFVEAACKRFSALSFSPDGKTLAASGDNGTIYLWEVETRKIRATVPGKGKHVSPLLFSPDGETLAAGSLDACSIQLWDLTTVKRKPPDAVETVQLWTALQGEDAAAAYRAVRTLTAFPTQAMPILRERLRPALLADEQSRNLDRALLDLDSDDFATREKADKFVQSLSILAEDALRRTSDKNSSLEMRRRVRLLLQGIERQKKTIPIQQLRAVEVLEHVGTDDARALLRELAKGIPQARLTQEAKASLARLAKRPARKP